MNFVYHVESFGQAPYAEAVFDDWQELVKYSNNVLQKQFKNHKRFSGKYTYRKTIFELSGKLIVQTTPIHDDEEYDKFGIVVKLLDFIKKES